MSFSDNRRVFVAVFLSVVMCVGVLIGNGRAEDNPADNIINTKYEIYSSDTTSQKITMSLLELEERVSSESMTISEAAEESGFATIPTSESDEDSSDSALLLDVITTSQTLNSTDLASFSSPPEMSVRDYYPEYYRVIVSVTDITKIHDLAAIDKVVMVKPQYEPKVMSGDIDNEADVAMGADLVRDDIGVDGFGQKIGILSDSFARTTEDNVPDDQLGWQRQESTLPIAGFPGTLMRTTSQDSGDLPPFITLVRDDHETGKDEGAAIGELIYDIAPGAGMLFHTSWGGEAVLADGIKTLVHRGATVLVDDTLYPDEPMYSLGIAASQANSAVSNGVPIFSAAGNLGIMGIQDNYRDIDSSTRDSTDTAQVRQGHDLHDWGSGNPFLPVTVPAGGSFQLMMQWNQPFQSVWSLSGAQVDLDLYVLADPSVSDLQDPLAKGIDAQGTTGAPLGDAFEMQNIKYTNGSSQSQTVYVAVDHFQGKYGNIPQHDSTPIQFRLIFWKSEGGVSLGAGAPVSFNAPTMFGHAAVANVISVGSVSYANAPLCNDSPQTAYPESNSSKGGEMTVFFNKSGDYEPFTTFRPALAGLDEIETTFFGEDGAFSGTSAAAANDAAVALLMKQANTGKKPGDILSTLQATACDVTGTPAASGKDDRSGSGVPDALSAVEAVNQGTNLALVIDEGLDDRVIVTDSPGSTTDLPSFAKGQTAYVNFAVKNVGVKRVRKSFIVQIFVDGKALAKKKHKPQGKFRFKKLDAGDVVSLDEAYSIGQLAAGTHTVEVVIDPQNRLKETSKLDNRCSKVIQVVGAPSNDNFVSAEQVSSGIPQSVSGSNSFATKESGEPWHGGNAGGASVWYRWVATTTEYVGIDTDGSSFDTLLAVYTGSAVNALTLIGQNDDYSSKTTSRVGFYATAGTTYYVAVDGKNGATGSIQLNWEQHPTNDNFAYRTAIGNAVTGTETGTNLSATAETTEPLHNGTPAAHSIWYEWTSPTTGTVTLDTTGSAYPMIIAVYTGTSYETLTPVASGITKITFSVGLGIRYEIALDGVGGAEGTTKLSWTAKAGNDMFADAYVLSGCTGTILGTNVGASKESGENNHADNAGGASVWYSWTSPVSDTVVLDTTGSNFDTLLAVYTGSAVNALAPVASNDNSATSTTTSKLSFSAIAGTEYRIAVDGKSGATGQITLNWSAAPKSDLFADRKTLSTSGTLTGSNLCASKETGEPSHAGVEGSHSVWFKWTASSSATGTVTFNTAGSTFDTLLAAYTGTSVGNLSPVASNDDVSGLLTSEITFAVTAGTTYAIAIDGKDSTNSTGDYVLNWTINP